MQLGWLKQGGCITEGVDLVNDELVEASSWPHAACLQVSFFGEHRPQVWRMKEEKAIARVKLKDADSVYMFSSMFSCFMF